MSNHESLEILNTLLGQNFNNLINSDLINYYSSPGNIINLYKFALDNNYDLKNITLKDFFKIIFEKIILKKDHTLKYLFYDLIEFYLNKINSDFSLDIYEKYNYFLRRISDTKKFNLDEESLFIEFENNILNG